MIPAAPTEAHARPPADAGAGPLPCHFCDAPAEASCIRCGALYCLQHGDAACDDCSQPASGLPSPIFFRTIVGLFAAAALAALVLLVFRPRLPGEHPPPSGSGVPVPTRATPSAGRGAPIATPAGGATPAQVAYTVQQGDTLGAIAAQYGVALDDLIAANPGVDPASLQIGAQLTIPAKR